MVLDCDSVAFSFKHPEKGDFLIDGGFSRCIPYTCSPRPYIWITFFKIKLFRFF